MTRRFDLLPGLRTALVALAGLPWLPASAAADEVWSPGDQEIAAMGGPLQALAVLRKEFETAPISLCAFVPDYKVRAQTVVNVTGAGVMVQCSGVASPVVFTYRQRAVFGLDALSRQDRLMLCETREGGAIYARKYDAKEWSCLESSSRNGRYDRERIRRFVTAWTILSRNAAVTFPDEASMREPLLSAPAITPEIVESLRRTQIQVELAIRENRTLDAAQLYSAAVNATPNWAAGQFNHALILGELEFYASAIYRMRAYLILSPDAPDARAARDKIYEWEARASR